jgi:DNA-binding transcriptional LysR family regulator
VNFRQLDLNLLRIFDTVLAEGSLTRAAERLAMTQPAISHALKRLREAMGQDLLVRTARGVRPTPYAEQIAPQVRAALIGLERALAPGLFDPVADHVEFRLAMADATASVLLPPLMAALAQAGAQADLRVLPLITREPRPALEQGDADMAVGYFPDTLAALAAEGDYAALRHERLYVTDYVCLMRHGHPLARQALTLERFCAAQHLLVSYSGRPHGLVDTALAALGRKRRVALTVNQFHTAGLVVQRSELLTVWPRSLLAAAGLESAFALRALPFPMGGVQVESLWHMRREADGAHRWLRERLREAAASAGLPREPVA